MEDRRRGKEKKSRRGGEAGGGGGGGEKGKRGGPQEANRSQQRLGLFLASLFVSLAESFVLLRRPSSPGLCKVILDFALLSFIYEHSFFFISRHSSFYFNISIIILYRRNFALN